MSTVLVLGSGGREHALVAALSSCPGVADVLVAPGNAGTLGTPSVTNITLNVKNHQDVVDVCQKRSVSLVVVGPEDPLADGLADTLNTAGVKVFGPSKAAAQIESSKSWAKEFMVRHSVPTAAHSTFTDPHQAKEFIKNNSWEGYVVKASGLAAGKGVVVVDTVSEGCQAIDTITTAHAAAATTLVIEEKLVGDEVSVLCFTDGERLVVMPPVQDHKRLLEGDLGPNTGGMGAYAPCPLISSQDLQIIKDTVLQRTVDGLRKEGIPFIGVLYAGLMMTRDGPKVLEFNCRFGDPETQVLMPLLTSGLYQIMLSCVEGQLSESLVKFDMEQSCVAVCVVSRGYPGSYPKGKVIQGVSELSSNDMSQVYHAGTMMKDGQLLTSGGRVLAVCVLGRSLLSAAAMATQAVAKIQFEGATFRKDIAAKAITRGAVGNITYKSSGVDIDAGEALVTSIKSLAASTHIPGVMGQVGSFGGLFDMREAGYQDPILVSGTDGVGTKLKIAQSVGHHNTIGEDLVAMCVNDVLVHGARPLFFLDYLATGRLEVAVAAQVVAGVAAGCRLAGCALIGGETAEMPGLYQEGEYDLAGFTLGAVDRCNLLPHTDNIVSGDVLIALPSSGLHSNGFSLVRKIVEADQLKYSDPAPYAPSESLGMELLKPTRIYPNLVMKALGSGLVKAAAHITGGGLIHNIPRVLPDNLSAVLRANDWDVHPVFHWIAAHGVSSEEMASTFNCGVGLVLVVAASDAATVTSLIENGEARVVGILSEKQEGCPRVKLEGLEEKLHVGASSMMPLCPSVNTPRKKVAVLISGSGTNLQALLDHCQSGLSVAKIVLVISNVAGVQGLQRAQAAHVNTKVIPHKNYKSREEFESAIIAELKSAGTELICLAGFMRILTASFVREWQGRLLNIHPSILPAFKGIHAQRQALQAGVTLTGCSVHFVSEEVDCGAIVSQEAVSVLPGDTEEQLTERIKIAEHKAFPRALEMVARGEVVLGPDGRCTRK